MNNLTRRSWIGVAVALMAVAVGSVRGRDCWLEVDPAAPSGPGKTEERALHLRVGEAFKADEERPLQKDRTSRFELHADRAKPRDLLAAGQDGQTPVAKEPPLPGACLVVMDRQEKPSTMEAEKFNRYLADEGQDAILGQRTRLGQGTLEGKEVGTRYLKILVPGQDPLATLPNTFYKRKLGQKLEILLQNNPGRMGANHKLTVKVLFEGKPLVGAKVFAYRHEGGTGGQATAPAASAAAPVLTATTGVDGTADFKLDQNGAWLVRLVHVRAGVERKSNPNGAWESFQGAYSFVTKDAPVVAPVVPAVKE